MKTMIYHGKALVFVPTLDKDTCRKCFFWNLEVEDCYRKNTGNDCAGGYWKKEETK